MSATQVFVKPPRGNGSHQWSVVVAGRTVRAGVAGSYAAAENQAEKAARLWWAQREASPTS